MIPAAPASTALGALTTGVARRPDRRADHGGRRARTQHRTLLLAVVAEDPTTARTAASALAVLDRRSWALLEPAVVALLVTARGDRRADVVRLLATHGTLQRARRDLHARRPSRRAAAADLLGRAGAPGSTRALVRLLDDRDRHVRQAAARSLGRLRSPGALPSLLRTLAGDPPRVPPAVVAQALLRIGPPGVPDLLAAVDHPTAAVRSTVAVVLGRLGAAAAVPALLDRLRSDPVTDVRCAAAAALGALGGPAAVPDLVAATAVDAPRPLRVAAARALGELGAAGTPSVPDDLRGTPATGPHRAAA